MSVNQAAGAVGDQGQADVVHISEKRYFLIDYNWLQFAEFSINLNILITNSASEYIYMWFEVLETDKNIYNKPQ